MIEARWATWDGKTVHKRLIFVATTPFAVNAFLRSHLLALARDYRVTLCVNVNAYPLSNDLLAEIEVEHIDFERKISPFKDLLVIFQLLRVFRRLVPYAVHSIMPKSGLLAMIAARVARVPHRFHTFTGQVWVTRRGVMRRLLMFLDRQIVENATSVFADSPSQCAVLESNGIVAAKEISVMGPGSISGVDLSRFHPNEQTRIDERKVAETALDQLVYLFVGRITRDKGIYDLISAFERVFKLRRDAELWIVGPDDEHLVDQIQASSLGGERRIRWCGATIHPERFMAAADILVLPSYREGFGSVIIEAAACGIPTVAYKIDGVIDAVEPDCTGLLVEAGNVQALADGMCRLARDVSLRLELGNRARSRAERRFSSEAVTHAWVKFYAGILDGVAQRKYGRSHGNG